MSQPFLDETVRPRFVWMLTFIHAHSTYVHIQQKTVSGRIPRQQEKRSTDQANNNKYSSYGCCRQVCNDFSVKRSGFNSHFNIILTVFFSPSLLLLLLRSYPLPAQFSQSYLFGSFYIYHMEKWRRVKESAKPRSLPTHPSFPHMQCLQTRYGLRQSTDWNGIRK